MHGDKLELAIKMVKSIESKGSLRKLKRSGMFSLHKIYIGNDLQITITKQGVILFCVALEGTTRTNVLKPQGNRFRVDIRRNFLTISAIGTDHHMKRPVFSLLEENRGWIVMH